MKPCKYCGVSIRTEFPNAIAHDFEADGRPHVCAQLNVSIALPGFNPCHISGRVTKAELDDPNFAETYLIPILEQLRIYLNDPAAVISAVIA